MVDGVEARGGIRVSAIVQSYNHERYIAQALDGALGQRGVGQYEILVGDDCSTDGTRAIIADYAARHPDLIRPVLPDVNLGDGGKPLFAELVRRSRGDYIAAMDADDYWTAADKLATQADHLDQNLHCAMVFHNAVRDHDGDPDRNHLYNPPEQPPHLTIAHLLPTNPVASCTPMFRRRAIFPLPDWYFEMPWGDLPLYLIAAQHGSLDYLPAVMSAYRLHGAGMFTGASTIAQVAQNVEFFRKAAPALGADYEDERRYRLAQALATLAAELLKAGRRDEAHDRIVESLSVLGLDLRRLHRRADERRRLALRVVTGSPALSTAAVRVHRRRPARS